MVKSGSDEVLYAPSSYLVAFPLATRRFKGLLQGRRYQHIILTCQSLLEGIINGSQGFLQSVQIQAGIKKSRKNKIIARIKFWQE
jgi:hypothetical protein